METAEILAKALDELELNGWCKGVFENVKGEHCALGAIGRVVGGMGYLWSTAYDELPATQALYEAIPQELIAQIESKWSTVFISIVIAEYNNNYCESIDDVFDWFTRAKEFC